MVEIGFGAEGFKVKVEAALIRSGIRGLGRILRDKLSDYLFVEFWATNGSQYAGQWRNPSSVSTWRVLDDTRTYNRMKYATIDPFSLPPRGIDVEVIEVNEKPMAGSSLRFAPNQITDFVVYFLP